MKKMEKESIFYLIIFVIFSIIIYLHSLGIFDPFKELPSPAWVWITVGIVLGMILEKGLKL